MCEVSQSCYRNSLAICTVLLIAVPGKQLLKIIQFAMIDALGYGMCVHSTNIRSTWFRVLEQCAHFWEPNCPKIRNCIKLIHCPVHSFDQTIVAVSKWETVEKQLSIVINTRIAFVSFQYPEGDVLIFRRCLFHNQLVFGWNKPNSFQVSLLPSNHPIQVT